MELAEIIAKLESASKISEISEVRSFVGYYEGVGEVEIKIHDRGPSEKHTRFFITAVPANDEIAPITVTGNSEGELDTAIATTHWFDLEKMKK